MTNNKRKGIQSDIVWAASKYPMFQHNKIYGDKINEMQKKKFKETLRKFLYQNIFCQVYKSSISESRLLDVIKMLRNSVRRKHANILFNRDLTFGSAQKVINIYLKVMWVMNLTEEPPHFPIDRKILGQLGLKINWTKLHSTEYKKIINSAREYISQNEFKKYNNSLAIWEAIEYSELTN